MRKPMHIQALSHLKQHSNKTDKVSLKTCDPIAIQKDRTCKHTDFNSGSYFIMWGIMIEHTNIYIRNLFTIGIL